MLRLARRFEPGLAAIASGLIVLAVALAVPQAAGPASASPTRALVTVKTLIVDALGTRTVDTHTARVPFGHTALLTSDVPYAGPPFSFRLDLGVSSPQPSGIPVRMVSRTWNGGPDDHGSRSVPARDETTVLSLESSYLLELHYDPASDRRILLSVRAEPIGEDEALPVPPQAHVAGRVRFILEIARQRGDLADPVDIHRLDSIVGRPVRYESGIRLPDEPGTILGAQVILTPEKSQGDLVTVKLELSGAEALGPDEKAEPFRHTEIRTVSSGARFEVEVTVPAAGDDGGDIDVIPVIYRVAVTTTLG